MGARDLPMLYLRLFRLAPVEDPRFLIGREAEMSGLADSLARWESGRKVSVLIVGARGTGKTSLLNCAVAGILSELPVVRGQFCGRISRTQELFAFLRGLLRLPDGADVEAVLSSGRRVVILEELERIFLRNINGFEALHAFLRLIESSSGSTLWILSTNEWSFRYLDAVAGLSRSFTHRVNAMTVPPEHLTGAVLQRHNLSGLRLQFEPVPEGDPRVSRVRRLLGLERDAQQLFFDSLFRQSEGVFRSAFELWQDSIERVEAGAVSMRHPLAPDYRPLMRELNLDDLFTLQVVLQHGGLDSPDAAGVLGIPLPVAARRIERLRALELLEPEPDCPGFRVRPQARRFVRDALSRYNLF